MVANIFLFFILFVQFSRFLKQIVLPLVESAIFKINIK